MAKKLSLKVCNEVIVYILQEEWCLFSFPASRTEQVCTYESLLLCENLIFLVHRHPDLSTILNKPFSFFLNQ